MSRRRCCHAAQRRVAAGLAERFATVDVAADNQAVVDGAPVVIVCVRPQVAQTVLAEVRFPADRVVISAVAGVPVRRSSDWWRRPRMSRA